MLETPTRRRKSTGSVITRERVEKGRERGWRKGEREGGERQRVGGEIENNDL